MNRALIIIHKQHPNYVVEENVLYTIKVVSCKGNVANISLLSSCLKLWTTTAAGTCSAKLSFMK